ncbi:MAG: DUF87 domain-containing protein [Candidatus Methanomethylicia archaeon]
MVHRKSIGVITGSPSTSEFEFKCFDVVKVNDFVEVFHDGRWHVLFVKSLRRDGDTVYASCICLGRPSDTPFKSGLNVYSASEGNIREVLGLTADYLKSVYIGLLKNYNVKIYIPIDRLNRIFIVGKPGSGKSYTVGVLIEELLKKGIPIIIIDVHGEYSSLKIPAKSGCSEFGVEPVNYIDHIIEFGDTKINPAANIDISELNNIPIEDIVLTGKCVIVNLRGFDLEDQISMAASLVGRLLDAAISRRVNPFYLVVDEAHRFIGKEKSESQLILRRFSQEGRKFGANLIVVSQRPQLLDTTVRGLSGTWIIHRLSDPNDISITIESGGLGKGWEDNIVWLDTGECIITGEAVDRIPYTVRVRCRETLHGGAGFNPLDFVSQEALKSAELKWRNLIKFGAVSKLKREVRKPKISPLFSQYYLPINFDGNKILSNLHDKFNNVSFSFKTVELHYYPALEIRANVTIKRAKPNIEFNDSYRTIIPILDDSSELDFSPRKFYYTNDFNETDLSESPMDFENMIFHSPKMDLSTVSSYERIINDFKRFLSFKFSCKLHYSPKFKIHSNPNEDVNVFIDRLKRIGKNSLNEKCSEVIRKYDVEISKHNVIIKSLKDDIQVKVQSIKRITSSINDLKVKLKGLDPSSKSYVSMLNRIQSLEERLSKLNKLLSEANVELERRETVIRELKRELNDRLKKLKVYFEDYGEIKTLTLNPNRRDIDVEYARIVWIPIFNGEVNISKDGLNRGLNFEWNGYNGFGSYGKCDFCGTPFNDLNSIEFCSICLASICLQHLLKCSVCNSVVCLDHAFKCDVCGRVLCVNEDSYMCSVCGAKVCSNCVGYCVKCSLEKSYCKLHIHVCNDCGKSYCDEHYKGHLAVCDDCGKSVCGESMVKCDVCGKLLCNNCVNTCAVCGSKVCSDHIWHCGICGKSLCVDEEQYICSICGKRVCGKHAYTCPSCGRVVCTEHTKICPNCGRKVCESCIITIKRLFRSKTGCKLCLKP